MKKRDLLVAGLLLMGLPVVAQPDLTNPQSAKVVFTQNFEADWEDWKNTEIDRITEIQYYVNTGTSDGNGFKPWEGAADWAKGPIRTDSIIKIYNGEMTVIDSGEKAKGNEEWGDDPDLYPGSTTIVEDAEHASDLTKFGEADGGGTHYFKFTSDTIKKINSGNGAYSGGYAARYRRNLFVRLKPGDITENSSYRLTFYVKAKTIAGHEDYSKAPRVYADVMRGYYHSEKPFSMGYINDNDHYQYTNTFEYTKEDFYADKNWDNWEKVTFMTYYTTDSIAENFMFVDGYWWASDPASWLWKKGAEGNTVDGDLRYIVQPDKYFVRLGFPCDYTVYSVDNISLTKSWIAGCEYYGDKMRVDFGYKNNMADLVAAEKKRTGVDQVELDPKYFQVWCLQKGKDPADPASWFAMPMRSAEYHADGYMYLFTKFYQINGEDYSYQFGDYDQVLVSFQNPADDKNIQLLYTSTPFPKGNDSVWIKGDKEAGISGKIVPDFVNEIAVPNPTASIWKGVYSKYDLPPVMTQAPYEEGSFGLEPVNQMKFKFSRKVVFDNTDKTEKAIAYVGDERWDISYDPSNDSILVITRPNGAGPLPDGDYVVELAQLHGLGTEAGADVIMHYNFGAVSRTLGSLDNLKTYYDAHWDTAANSTKECLPEGTALFVTSGNSWSGFTEAFTIGDGTVRDANCRMYWFAGKYNRAFNLNSRGTTVPARLYLGFEEGYEINLAKGNYSLNFGVVGINKMKPTKVYIYPWDPDNEDWVKNPKKITKISEADKVLIANFTPSRQVEEGIRGQESKELDMLDIMAISFNVKETGRYIIEFEYASTSQEWSGYSGILLSSPTITAQPPVSFNPINALNAAVDNASTRIKAADDSIAIYGGTAYNNLVAKRDFYNYNPEGGFKPYPTEPSKWTEAKDDLNKYTTALAERMDTIDALVAKIKDANDKLAKLDDDYLKFDVSKTLQAEVNYASNLNEFAITRKTGKEIADETDKLDKAITAVDNRATKNDNLNTQIAAAQKLVDEAKRPDYAEFPVLQDTLAAAKALDAINCRDGEVDTMTSKLLKAAKIYELKVGGYLAQVDRLRALRDLAIEFECDDVVDNWAISNFVDTTQVDNDEIADIYKTAIKLAFYEILAEDPKELDGTDLTPFIKNYNLYALNQDSIADHSDLELPGARNNDALKGKNNQGKTYMYVKHQWGQAALDNKIWVVMFDSAYANVFPGWTVQSVITGNHSMVTPDPTATVDYYNFKYGMETFDGALTMDWNSSAILKGVVEGLPYGYYSLAVEATIDASSSVKTDFKATTKVGVKDSVLAIPSVTSDGSKTLEIDSITVLDGTLNIELDLQSNDGGSKADNFSLTFLGTHKDVNYASLIDDLKAELKDKIDNRATFVNAPAAVGASVEYYTVGGMKVAAPKAGEIIIRKTTKNGKVVVDKVLVK
jgi:hypothetical protein